MKADKEIQDIYKKSCQSDLDHYAAVSYTHLNQTIVMITHNNEIAQLADRIVRIEDGKIGG